MKLKDLKGKMSNMRYIHNKTGNLYFVFSNTNTKLKNDKGEWVEAIIYHKPDKTTEYFIRTQEDFNKSFTKEGDFDIPIGGI